VRAAFARLGFAAVVLDPAGYRRGALLTVLADSRG
jgi:PP-loop superfamily ATP-utilizing enzyme